MQRSCADVTPSIKESSELTQGPSSSFIILSPGHIVMASLGGMNLFICDSLKGYW
jgi:hypothetical protein